MPGFSNRALCDGTTSAWEYWTVWRQGHLAEAESHKTRDAALDAIRHLKAIGSPGPYAIKHHLVIEHSGPEQPVGERLLVAGAENA